MCIETLYRLYGLSIGDKSGNLRVNFCLLFSGSKIFLQRISRTLFVGARRNLAVLGSGQSKLIRRISSTFVRGVPWYHAATCISPSITDTFVKWFFDNFPMFAYSFSVLSNYCVAPGLDASFLYKYALHRAVVPCDSTTFLLKNVILIIVNSSWISYSNKL